MGGQITRIGEDLDAIVQWGSVLGQRAMEQGDSSSRIWTVSGIESVTTRPAIDRRSRSEVLELGEFIEEFFVSKPLRRSTICLTDLKVF